jgi:hypothetical protein
MERTCLGCKHFYFSAGSPSYSELTPGNSASMSCSKNVWDFDFEADDDLAKTLYSAVTCGHYEFDSERLK